MPNIELEKSFGHAMTTAPCSNLECVQVAVGVLTDAQGRVLVALRHAHQHQGGLWEFPGGKINIFETDFEALRREFLEELGVRIHTASPLITIRHAYPDLAVQLNTYRIDAYTGTPRGAEGQLLRWVEPENLAGLQFPAANLPIVTAIQLPDFYAILDSGAIAPSMTGAELVGRLLDHLRHLLDQDIKLIQARLKNLDDAQLQLFEPIAMRLCEEKRATLLFNSALPGVWRERHGLHLTSADLMNLKERPHGFRWLAASCHNFQQLQHAQAIGVDFAVLAPVLATPTHPGAPVLGWDVFTNLLAKTNMPVYALGGMRRTDLFRAKYSGARGIAGIRLFLE